MNREPIGKLVKLGFPVPEDIVPIELHAHVTLWAFRDFHVSQAIPDLTNVEMYLSPAEIRTGFTRAIDQFAATYHGGKTAIFKEFSRAVEEPRDPDKSYWWYWLAMSYATGCLGPRDQLKSTDYFTKSAEQGYPTAAMMLGEHFESIGDGNEAYRWYAVASECEWSWAIERKSALDSFVGADLRARLIGRAEADIHNWDIDCRNRHIHGGHARKKYYYARIGAPNSSKHPMDEA